jgi:hypothetical protein
MKSDARGWYAHGPHTLLKIMFMRYQARIKQKGWKEEIIIANYHRPIHIHHSLTSLFASSSKEGTWEDVIAEFAIF